MIQVIRRDAAQRAQQGRRAIVQARLWRVLRKKKGPAAHAGPFLQ